MKSLTCGIWKVQRTSEYDKKEADTENKLVVTSGGTGASLGVAEWAVQTIEGTIGYKDVLYHVGNISNIL